MEAMLKPYLEYHQIDLPWQQHAPSHWTRLRLKHLLREVDERTQTGEETLMSLTRSRGLVSRSEITDKPPSAKTLVGYKVCRPGDIVMNRMQAWSGMFGLASEVGLVSPDYAVLRLIGKADGRFLLSLLKSPGPVSHFAALSTGMGSGFNRLYTDQLGAVPIATPPHEEQVQVAMVTRDIDRRVNRLLRAKQRLIALLNEQKQAIIQRAVTRGLDPDVPLKPSGVDWLGDVPAHWEVMRLKHTLSGRLEYGANESAKETNQDHPRYIRITDFGSDGNLREETFRSLPPHIAQNYLLSEGDILFARSGATVGKTFQFKSYQAAACYAGYLIKASPNPARMRSDFLYLYTKSKSYDDWKMSIFIQATIQNIGADKYKELEVPVPPVSEQDVIVDFLLSELNQINAVLSTAREEIALIREYRTRLIADVVTGKLDVRGVAVPEVEGDGAIVDMDVAGDNGMLDDEILASEEA